MGGKPFNQSQSRQTSQSKSPSSEEHLGGFRQQKMTLHAHKIYYKLTPMPTRKENHAVKLALTEQQGTEIFPFQEGSI